MAGGGCRLVDIVAGRGFRLVTTVPCEAGGLDGERRLVELVEGRGFGLIVASVAWDTGEGDGK